MSDTPISRPGQYGTAAAADAPPTGPAGAPPAPPLPPVKLLDPNDPVDALAKQILGDVPLPDDETKLRTMLAEARKKAVEWRSLTPAERWLRNIEKAKLDEAEAVRIQTECLGQGYWEKDYDCFNGRLKIRLRSRDYDAGRLVTEAFDTSNTGDLRILEDTKMRVFLAYSLVEYNGKKLDVASWDEDPTKHREAYQKRLRFCARLADGVIPHLMNALRDFDAKTYAAMSEGAESGF